jgi:hypothetical protein
MEGAERLPFENESKFARSGARRESIRQVNCRIDGYDNFHSFARDALIRENSFRFAKRTGDAARMGRRVDVDIGPY